MAVITLPTTGEKVNAFTPEEIIGLVAKEAQSLITGADITLKYPQFETTVPESRRPLFRRLHRKALCVRDSPHRRNESSPW